MLTIKVQSFSNSGAVTMTRGSRIRHIASGHIGTVVETQAIRELVQSPNEWRKETAKAPGDWGKVHGDLEARIAREEDARF